MHGSVSGQLQKQPEGTLELVQDEAFVLVKAAPRHSQSFGETVCCAGIDLGGNWVRLYPVSFRLLTDEQRFARWDHIRYRWSNPKATKDIRKESRRLDPNSVEILGKLKQRDRNRLVSRFAVDSLKAEFAAGRSLALLRVEVLDFWAERHSDEELQKRNGVLASLRARTDLFAAPTSLIPLRSSPFAFKYRYRDADRERIGTCQDWETEQTFFARLRETGSEQAALDWMIDKFGREYPEKGMALAMGTHRYRTDQWLINGVIRLDDEPQLMLL